eukprot:scaffold123446_cov75-Phaeocystis_antarctica.AAC.1
MWGVEMRWCRRASSLASCGGIGRTPRRGRAARPTSRRRGASPVAWQSKGRCGARHAVQHQQQLIILLLIQQLLHYCHYTTTGAAPARQRVSPREGEPHNSPRFYTTTATTTTNTTTNTTCTPASISSRESSPSPSSSN